MKAKMKFDLGAVKRFVIEHGEKLAFGAAALLFLLFVYSAFTREVLSADKQPEKLRDTANQVQSHVQQSTFDPKRENIAVVSYATRAKRIPLVLENYAGKTLLNGPVGEQKPKREEPATMVVEDLRGGSGFGTFALRGGAVAADATVRRGDAAPAASAAQIVQRRAQTSEPAHRPSPDAKMEGRAWAVVTGLVPLRKQTLEYVRVFDNAEGFDASRDRPVYLSLENGPK
jgi:hypothetical protein